MILSLHLSLKTPLLAAVLTCAMLGGARAQSVRTVYADTGYAAAPAYGYGGSAIRGDYVGAPLTRFPRPDAIVPSAWGYGTYGVPTVAGIHPAPVGTPTVYVIDGPAPVARRRATARPRILARARAGTFMRAPMQAPVGQANGARVVSVRVPPRQAALR